MPDLGTLVSRTDGRYELHYTRTLPHPPEKVWRALTEPEHLAAWFPSTIEGDHVPGSQLTFRFKHSDDVLQGELLAYVPNERLELRWGEDELRFELHPIDGGTRLELVDTIVELGKAARDGAGWHECLELLATAVTLDDPTIAPGEVWTDVHPAYVATFGPEASTVGPPAGHDPAYVDTSTRRGPA